MTAEIRYTWYSVLTAVVVGMHAFARTIVVPTQPVSPYADTEISTNVVIQTGRTDVRDVKIRLQLDGTPTNNLEIAFGCDANTNGVLDVSEIETVYGWRARRQLYRCVVDGYGEFMGETLPVGTQEGVLWGIS